MDRLRIQIAALVKGPAAINLARHADITRMESTIDGSVSPAWCSASWRAWSAWRCSRPGFPAVSRGPRRTLTGWERESRCSRCAAAADELGRLADSLVRAETLLARRTAELVTARDEAVTATQAKNAFLSSTSHELRTPLNAVLGFAQLLQLSASAGGPGRGRADPHRRAPPADADQRADRHRQDRDGRIQPVGGAGQHAAGRPGNLRAHGAAGRRPLHHDQPALPAARPGGRADRQRLRQILVNLLSNAIKYNRAGGTVIITCQEDGPDQVSLE